MEEQDRIWELLAKRLSGEIQSSEVKELSALMEEVGKEEAEYMINVMESYANAIQNAPESKVTLETVRQYREKTLALRDAPLSTRTDAIKKMRYWWYSVAAIILLMVGLFIIFSQENGGEPSMIVVTTQDASKSNMVLPDGTQVWLNAGSRLSYPTNFKEAKVREVTLSGEAYFKVKHDACHPFIIHTQYLNIKDLGTAFNVRAYPEEDKSEATLIEGSITVSLREDPGKKLHLKPGEKIMYSVNKNKLVKNRNNNSIKNKTIKSVQHLRKLEVTHIHPVVIHPGDTVISEIAWLDNQLVFNNESFAELAIRMNRFFNVNIVIKSKQVQKYSFTGIFEGESLQQALDELKMIRPFSYSINKNKVVINTTQ